MKIHTQTLPFTYTHKDDNLLYIFLVNWKKLYIQEAIEKDYFFY